MWIWKKHSRKPDAAHKKIDFGFIIVYTDKNGVECTVYKSSRGIREVCSGPNEKMLNRMNEAKKRFSY